MCRINFLGKKKHLLNIFFFSSKFINTYLHFKKIFFFKKFFFFLQHSSLAQSPLFIKLIFFTSKKKTKFLFIKLFECKQSNHEPLKLFFFFLRFFFFFKKNNINLYLLNWSLFTAFIYFKQTIITQALSLLPVN